MGAAREVRGAMEGGEAEGGDMCSIPRGTLSKLLSLAEQAPGAFVRA